LNIVIGIDGGSFKHLNIVLQRGLTPNFKRLIENGFSANLRVTNPPITIPSWPCTFSGLTPEDLGFYYFTHPDKGLFNSSYWRNKSIFSLINEKSFIMNVPGTFPSWKVNGEMITGMLSPSISCFPSELKLSIQKNWIIDADNVPESFFAFKQKSSLFLEKMKEDFKFLTYVIRIPDNLTHRSHGGKEKTLSLIYQVYLKIDKFLGKILENEQVDNIIIVSDHGLKHYSKGFYIRRWLEKKGILFINTPKPNKLLNVLLKSFDFIRLFVNSSYLKKYFNKFLHLKIIKSKIKIPQHSIMKIDRNITRVKNFCSNIGGIILIGKDKQKNGILYKELLKSHYVDNVIRSTSEDFPDFIVSLKKDYYFCEESSLYIKRRRDIIDHSNKGLFIAYGKNIKSGKEDFVSYQNVAPTLLKLLNIAKPDYMKGEALDIIN